MVRGPPPCRSRRIGRGKVEKGRGKTILRLKGQILPKPYHSFPVVDSRYDSPSPTTGGAAVCRSSHSRSLARSWTTFWCQATQVTEKFVCSTIRKLFPITDTLMLKEYICTSYAEVASCNVWIWFCEQLLPTLLPKILLLGHIFYYCPI
ncbi:hypothetical protein BHE74_00002172 [Ensete ventricosum]|nr:hypothetical protein BHE74_00002172 [Ensete ventricosum]